MNQKSFTLIEMLIVLVIISALSISIIINKQSNQSRTALFDEVKKAALSIRKAQNFAINSIQESGSVPCGYGVFFDKTNDAYKIFFEDTTDSACDTDMMWGTQTDPQESQGEKESENFSGVNIEINNIEINSNSANSINIFFVPPDPLIYFDGIADKNIEVEFKVSGKSCPSDFCKKIIVNSLGQVSIN